MAIDYFEIFKNTMKDVDRERLLEMLYTCFEMQRKIQNYKIEELKEDEQDKEIKKITLVFENYETCELNPDMFERLSIYGIKQDITVFNSCKLIKKEYSCDDFVLEINKKGLKQNASSYGNSYQSLENRLKAYDITAVDITYTDNTKQSIYVLWNDEDEYENKYQTITQSITQWGENFITVRIGGKDE